MTGTFAQAPRRTPARPARSRGGRPSADRAGEVDARILEAAGALFLERGLDGTSFDQIAAAARAGKASIYARHANKEALFLAVVRHRVASTATDVATGPAQASIAARLEAVAVAIIDTTLEPGTVALMRVIVAEAGRLPGLAAQADRLGREGCTAKVVAAITGPDPVTPARLERARALAGSFVDLVFVPIQMRALLGESGADVKAAAPGRIRNALGLLEAAGRLREW